MAHIQGYNTTLPPVRKTLRSLMHTRTLQHPRLYKLELIEDIGLEASLGAHAGPCHLLLHGRIILGRSAFLVSAHGVAAEIAEARVEVLLGFFGAFTVGL